MSQSDSTGRIHRQAFVNSVEPLKFRYYLDVFESYRNYRVTPSGCTVIDLLQAKYNTAYYHVLCKINGYNVYVALAVGLARLIDFPTVTSAALQRCSTASHMLALKDTRVGLNSG